MDLLILECFGGTPEAPPVGGARGQALECPPVGADTSGSGCFRVRFAPSCVAALLGPYRPSASLTRLILELFAPMDAGFSLNYS